MSTTRNLRHNLARSALALAIGTAAIASAPSVFAQSTTGSIYGSAPAGSTVVVKSNSGFTRTITVDASGRYSISSLPVGDYVVVAKQGDETVGTRSIPVLVGAGSDASFVDSMMEVVEVVGQAGLPDIDVSSTDTRVVITAADLQRMPIGRSAEAIALLAPGVNAGSTTFDPKKNMVSFGGAGVSENAYYINGFLANDPLANLGGFSLPFGAINQQETYTGGYGAKYGRSSGGVINQVGARGDNEVRYGTQVAFQPKALRSTGTKGYFQNMDLPEGYHYTDPELAGTLLERKDDDFALSSIYSAYVSGPILEDKLYGFLSYETEAEDYQNSPTALGNPRVEEGDTDTSKIYAKLDWNVTDGHLLEFTYMGEKEDYSGTFSAYDLETGAIGEQLGAAPNESGHESKFTILNYTGFLTDTLTLNAMYGHGAFTYYDKPVGDVTSPFISNAVFQNPALNGGAQINGLAGGVSQRDAEDTTDGIRMNLEWVVGDHTLTFGIDNMEFEAVNEGTEYITDRWVYAKSSTPTAAIRPALGVVAPGGEGYYVYQLYYKDATSMKLEQDAYYVEDRWQVTDDVMLSLGLRNDKFTNYNNVGETYLDSDDQWAPRLGVAWDVMGDSSLKVFANAGRYYLAMPNNVAIRGASASTYTFDYWTYSGINADGSPIVDEHLSPGPVSSNGEYGQPIDPLDFAPSDLESMYQDEYILGFEKTLGDNYNFGAKFTFRDLKSAMDDVCDPYRLIETAGYEVAGYTPEGKVIGEKADGSTIHTAYCYMFNPGGSNTFSVANIGADGNPDGTRTEITMSAADWEMPDLKRQYSAIDLFLERPFDGKWEARLDYTYSKLEGNTEGQVKSEFGQDNISKTQDWDVSELMDFSDGYLANDRRHQLKLRGSYALTEELMIGANMSIRSGMPVSCLGLFNPDGSIDEGTDAADPVGYGSSYHTCFGSVAEPGKERTPWTRSLDMGLTYTPAMLDDKLTLSLQVFNVLDEQKATQLDVTSQDDAYTVSNTYKSPLAYQAPRYAMLTATLNF